MLCTNWSDWRCKFFTFEINNLSANIQIDETGFEHVFFYERKWVEMAWNGLKNTTQKMKFFFKDFFSKCDQIHSLLQIWSHLLKKSLMENFIFCAVKALKIILALYLAL